MQDTPVCALEAVGRISWPQPPPLSHMVGPALLKSSLLKSAFFKGAAEGIHGSRGMRSGSDSSNGKQICRCCHRSFHAAPAGAQFQHVLSRLLVCWHLPSNLSGTDTWLWLVSLHACAAATRPRLQTRPQPMAVASLEFMLHAQPLQRCTKLDNFA